MAREGSNVTNAEETYLLRHSMELSPLRMQRPLVQPMPRKVSGVKRAVNDL